MTVDGSASVFAAAVVVDVLFGEVPTRVHPVVWMGRVTRSLEVRMPREGLRAVVAGGLLVAFTTGIFVAGAYGLLAAASHNPWVHAAMTALLLTTTFSVRLLLLEVGRLGKLLDSGRVDEARAYLPRLCSRDASELTAADVGAAGISSGAENAVDSIIAPWLWWLALGVPGAVLYRVINTMDAMIGYRGEYERLGKVAARLDDLADWIPARMTAILMWLIGGRLGAGRPTARLRGLAVTLRDAPQTPSPNGGWPMAMTAGLIGVRLGKPDVYLLNPEGAEVTSHDLALAVRLIRRTAAVAAILVVASHLASC